MSLAVRIEHPLVRLVAAAAAAGLMLAAAGAFDTEQAATLPRLCYWLAITAVSIAALESAHRLLVRQVPAGNDLPVRLVAWAVLVLPLNSVAVMACKLLFGGWPSLGGFLHLLPGMAAILAALQFMLASLEARPTATRRANHDFVPANTLPPPDAGLRDRLPLFLRDAAIFALEAEDHYVRVHTAAGDALVRMRLRDAIALIDAEGVRPHRSWWVARTAVASLQRRGEGRVLVLANGRQVPVSRAAQSTLGPLFDAREERAG